MIAKRRRDLHDDLGDRANADAEQHGGQCGIVDGSADDRAKDRGRSGDGAEADQGPYWRAVIGEGATRN